MHIIPLKRLAIILLPLFSFQVLAEDLLTVFRLGQTNDPTLQAAKEAQLASIEETPQARAQFLPVIKATATHQANNTRVNNPSTANNSLNNSHFNQSVYGLSLTQPIFYYQQWIQLAKASEQVKQANATYAAAEQDLIVRVTQAYFNVLKAFDNLKFAQANRKAFSKFLDQTEQRYKVGLIAITDVQIAKAQKDNAYAQEISAENNLANQKENLRVIIGKDIENYAFLRPALSLPAPDPANLEQWVIKALDQNLTLQAKRFQVETTRADLKMFQAGHLPTININGNYNGNSPTPTVQGNKASNIGLQVSMPLFSGGAVLSKTRQARHLHEQAHKQMEVLYRQTESNTRQAYRGVLTQISQTTALKQAIVSNKSALEATQASFNVGTRTIVDVLNAQSSLIQAEQKYADARYDYILQSIQLKQAAGTLSPEDLQHINAWLIDAKKEKDKS